MKRFLASAAVCCALGASPAVAAHWQPPAMKQADRHLMSEAAAARAATAYLTPAVTRPLYCFRRPGDVRCLMQWHDRTTVFDNGVPIPATIRIWIHVRRQHGRLYCLSLAGTAPWSRCYG